MVDSIKSPNSVTTASAVVASQNIPIKSGGIAPYAIGAAVALGLAAGAFFFSRSPDQAAEGAKPAETVTQSSESPPPSTSASAAETPPVADKPKDKPDEPEPKDEKVAVNITCEPACDRIEIDGKALEKIDEKVELAPRS